MDIYLLILLLILAGIIIIILINIYFIYTLATFRQELAPLFPLISKIEAFINRFSL